MGKILLNISLKEDTKGLLVMAFIQGFGIGGGLIVAIGAQNAFVLSQSVRGNHHVVIALICILCDAIFITAGYPISSRAFSASSISMTIAVSGNENPYGLWRRI